MTIYLGTTPLTSTSGVRNIGQIIQSTIPLTDAGLHLLDGSLISGSGSYADFVTYMASLVSSSPDCFCSEADWQTAITTYGVCGKFVYDSVNNTVRLPKYSDKIWSGLGTAGVKGNGMTLGLTNGTSNVGLALNNSSSTPFAVAGRTNYGKNVGVLTGTYTSADLGYTYGITTDVTKSGIIADLSTITTALEGYWYIVIAASTKTEIEVDIDEIATDLNGKADVDLSNVLSNIDYVVESKTPTAGDQTWYRKYKSGWVEQGGFQSASGNSGTVNVTLSKEMASTYYTITTTDTQTAAGSGGSSVKSTTLATTSFDYIWTSKGITGFYWEVKGMGA